jgi:hypothetical protein
MGIITDVQTLVESTRPGKQSRAPAGFVIAIAVIVATVVRTRELSFKWSETSVRRLHAFWVRFVPELVPSFHLGLAPDDAPIMRGRCVKKLKNPLLPVNGSRIGEAYTQTTQEGLIQMFGGSYERLTKQTRQKNNPTIPDVCC